MQGGCQLNDRSAPALVRALGQFRDHEGSARPGRVPTSPPPRAPARRPRGISDPRTTGGQSSERRPGCSPLYPRKKSGYSEEIRGTTSGIARRMLEVGQGHVVHQSWGGPHGQGRDGIGTGFAVPTAVEPRAVAVEADRAGLRFTNSWSPYRKGGGSPSRFVRCWPPNSHPHPPGGQHHPRRAICGRSLGREVTRRWPIGALCSVPAAPPDPVDQRHLGRRLPSGHTFRPRDRRQRLPARRRGRVLSDGAARAAERSAARGVTAGRRGERRYQRPCRVARPSVAIGRSGSGGHVGCEQRDWVVAGRGRLLVPAVHP